MFVSQSVQSLHRVRLFETPWTAAHQASLSITNSQSLLKLMSIKLVMPSNHLILCHLLLLPSICPSIRVFSNESVLHIRWPRCCRNGDPFQGPKLGSCLTLRNELSEETHVLTKQEILLGKGTRVESSRVQEPKRTALPHSLQVLW